MKQADGEDMGVEAGRGRVPALVAVPLAAQSFSEGFTFLKAVRERDGATAERILSNPASTAINHRDLEHRRGRAAHPGPRPRQHLARLHARPRRPPRHPEPVTAPRR